MIDHEAEMTDFLNELMNNSDDSWDDDEAMEAIVIAYVRHLEAQVKQLGGCTRRWCHWEDSEPCNHGYLKEPHVVLKVSDFGAQLHNVDMGPQSGRADD